MFNPWSATELLIKVIEKGSFSAAANTLGLSKSHVSRKISELENHLGSKLINRTTRKLVLTDTGRVYYNRCREIAEQIDDVEQMVLASQTEPRGKLRISVAGAFGERYIAPAAASFMATHKQLQIELEFSNRNVDIVEEGYDLAIRAGVLEDSSLVARRIASRNLILCASRHYFDEHGTPNSISSLKDHNCLLGSRKHWRLYDPENRWHLDVAVQGTWRSNNGYALLSAVQQGIGIAQLPEFYVHNELAAGRLIEIMSAFKPRDMAVWAVYPSRRHLSPKVRLFIDYLITEIEQIEYL
ncbi:LysR family transcriptional regulator [Zhongshania marina]|uniref:LysR family transcriptional regulator n=1 Tax=Zhongshania marina TaxID=2304603 RepID=A0A2S4HKH7_9GAMM|nr:LysR family transcriptional regulator [Marortus luteolus]POP54496.1 LysR family transcriptional regulator [Marortus luteolus]